MKHPLRRIFSLVVFDTEKGVNAVRYATKQSWSGDHSENTRLVVCYRETMLRYSFHVVCVMCMLCGVADDVLICASP